MPRFPAIFEEHFTPPTSPEGSRRLFELSVNLVELEPFTFCNRKCWFCPNSSINRQIDNRYMDENLYLAILRDLASINYRGVISYCRYNEPLADRIILERLRQAREIVPDAYLSTHTNGDYLTRNYLDELRKAGLNTLRVQVYMGNKQKFSDAAILTRMSRRLNDLGLPYEFIRVIPMIRYIARVKARGMEVTFDARNFGAIGVDRGQTVALPKPYVRNEPCFEVLEHIYIDYDGSMLPCCNLRSDEPSHEPYVVGKLGEGKSIFEVYADRRLAEWRKRLLNFGEKDNPCRSCRYEAPTDTPKLRAAVANIQPMPWPG